MSELIWFGDKENSESFFLQNVACILEYLKIWNILNYAIFKIQSFMQSLKLCYQKCQKLTEKSRWYCMCSVIQAL